MEEGWITGSLLSISKNKKSLYHFDHHQSKPDRSSVPMNGCTFNEASCLGRLLGLKVSPDNKWNWHPLLKIFNSFYCCRKYPTPPIMLYLYNGQSSFFCLDRTQNRLHALMRMTYFPTHAMSQAYRCFHDNFLDELHFLVSSVQTFTALTLHGVESSPFPPYSDCKEGVQLYFFLRTATL